MYALNRAFDLAICKAGISFPVKASCMLFEITTRVHIADAYMRARLQLMGI